MDIYVCVFGVKGQCQDPPSLSAPEALLPVLSVGEAGMSLGMCRHVQARVKLLLNTASPCPAARPSLVQHKRTESEAQISVSLILCCLHFYPAVIIPYVT